MNVWFTPETAAISAERLRPWACLFVHLWRKLERKGPEPQAPEGPVARGYFTDLRDLLFIRDLLRVYGVEPVEPSRGQFGFKSRRAGDPVWIQWSLFDATTFRWSAEVRGAQSWPLDRDGPWDTPHPTLERG